MFMLFIRHRSSPGLTERLEMFICKKEVINAYTELNDPVVQRERFAQQAKVSHVLNVDARCAIFDYPPTIRYGEGTVGRVAYFWVSDHKPNKNIDIYS